MHPDTEAPDACAAILALADDTRITATQFRVLALIAKGYQKRADMAAKIGKTIVTVARAIDKLVSLGLIDRETVKGKPSKLTLATRIIPDTCITGDTATRITNDATTRIIPDTRITSDTPTRITSDTRITNDTGQPVDNVPRACIEHASARAETLTLNTSSELYPERVERVCVARAMPAGGGNLDPDWVLSPDDRAFANERGFMNGSCDELFGQFLDHCATKGPRLSASWRSEWRKWVRNEIKFSTERAQRAGNRESTNGQPSNHSYASAGKPRARSVETQILMRDLVDDQPRLVGRLDFSPGK